MGWWKNEKPGILGLSHSGESAAGPQLVKPGEVFEADDKDIPKAYLDNKWVVKADKPKDHANPPPPPGSTQTTGPEPVQRSGTSDEQSTTDAEAAASKVYENASTPAERGALRDKEAGEPASDEKHAKKHK